MKKKSIKYLTNENRDKWSQLSNNKIAIITTEWNRDILDNLEQATKDLLNFLGIKYKVIMVPGAYEIPYVFSKLNKEYSGAVVLGAVIKGDTYHFNAIVDAVSTNLQMVSIDKKMPVGFGVLTTNNLQQAIERSRMDNDNKGYEATSALLDLLVLDYG